MVGSMKRLMGMYPLATNMVVYGCMYMGTELAQQLVYNRLLIPEGKTPPPIDKASLGRFAVMGTCYYPVTLYYWYKWLDNRFPGTGVRAVVPKMMLDQFLITPVLLSGFFILMSAMEGKEDIFEECKEKAVPTFTRSCAFWMPAQLLNFTVIPPAGRVVYVGVCGMIWINILCWIKRQPTDKH